MSRIREEKRRKGKQVRFVNSVVKDFDESSECGVNLFGDSISDCVPKKFDHLIQCGNMHNDRSGFCNPQHFRVYSMLGLSPTLAYTLTPNFLIRDNGEYKVRTLTGTEAFRLMGVEDSDIDKLVEGGLSSGQMCALAGNSIVVDVMSELFKEMINH